MAQVEFKSPHDGSVLRFAVTDRTSEEVEFEVLVRTPWFSGRVPSSTYLNGSPAAMFAAMAESWRGWDGPLSWQDLESRVSLEGTSDSTGHVRITVEVKGQDYESQLRVVLMYEAGQLEEMSNAITKLLG